MNKIISIVLSLMVAVPAVFSPMLGAPAHASSLCDSCKILKLTYEGKDFGYMGLNGKGIFYGGADISDAVEFKEVKYQKADDAYYYEVAKDKNHYLDIKGTSSVLFSDKPIFSVDTSTIVAWQLIGSELHAIIGGQDTRKVVSRSATDEDSKILYGNFPEPLGDGHPCGIRILEKKSS
ncbi:hypothetical protein [Okeania sp. KiyG1]|uniref:hypothetical protein n=1 Tax=Okeania sp. KiyG1 TaxID=2720165 RepID=UPI0019248038|nr:hypothetical protein [Okeania sp. KiyG1]GGA09104.1 hypothetical protein CYANOKiyG1_21930 [Okeania sp. KiyG1]